MNIVVTLADRPAVRRNGDVPRNLARDERQPDPVHLPPLVKDTTPRTGDR
jgi:hypothetical protein